MSIAPINYSKRISLHLFKAPFAILSQYLLPGEVAIDANTLQIVRRPDFEGSNLTTPLEIIGSVSSLIDPNTQKIFENLIPTYNNSSQGIKFNYVDTHVDLAIIVGQLNDIGYVASENCFYSYLFNTTTNTNSWTKLDIAASNSNELVVSKSSSGILSSYSINIIEYNSVTPILQMQLPENPDIGEWVKVLVKKVELRTFNIISNDRIMYGMNEFTIDTPSIVKFVYLDSEIGWAVEV